MWEDVLLLLSRHRPYFKIPKFCPLVLDLKVVSNLIYIICVCVCVKLTLLLFHESFSMTSKSSGLEDTVLLIPQAFMSSSKATQ